MLPPRVPLARVVFVCSWLLLSAACGDDSDPKPVQQTDSAVGATPVTPNVTPPTSSVTNDAGIGIPAMDAAIPPPLDAGPGIMDAAGQKPDAPDCNVDATPYACACAANPASCAHPLAGRYAVRTVSYARQKAVAAGAPVDVVSKGVLLSVADISPTGVVKEHLCLLELINPDGMYSWVAPAATQRIPDSTATLEERNGGFVRPLAGDKINVSWSPEKQPADCAPGTTHSTGCLCFDAGLLPSDPKDCRVTDLDEDGTPGLKLAVSPERPVDPATAASLLDVSIAGVKAVEWRLPGTAKTGAGAQVVGGVEGSVSQNQLSVTGDLAAEIGKVQSATCASDTAHVELVRGDFDCTAVMAGRTKDLDGHGIFHPALDAVRPEPTACPDPECAVDSDRDGTPDCKDLCPLDAAKLVAGTCGCGVADTNTDGDTLPDCTDECDMDNLKTVAGSCGCGMAETNTDGDGVPDCVDACPMDPAKTVVGVCGCGVAETNTDGDSLPDCTDQCDADPAKTVPGVCNCGVADTDTDSDGTPDCNELCDFDKDKLVPGVCSCGVPDRDLNGDGSIDCSDACPDDPAKIAGGVCGCGVPDVNSDNDAQFDCFDECDQDPLKVAAGTCGCGVPESVCNNPLLGTYAVRSVIHGRQRLGNDAPTTSRAIGYALVTVTNGANGALSVSEKSCWLQTLPNPNESGTKVYTWSKPAWVQATAATVRTGTVGAGGSLTATSPSVNFGWNPARQPATCSASSTPPAPWDSSWGTTCTCGGAANTLPPYDRNGAPYDCRLTDEDGDSFPGLSAYVATSAPTTPDQDVSGGLTTARVFAASTGSSQWTLTPAADRKHTGTITDNTSNVVVGCTGGACGLGLGPVSPAAAACPAALNTLQFIPVTGSTDSCDEILAQRNSLFDGPIASWAQAAACPAP